MEDLIQLPPSPQLAASRLRVLDKALAQGSFKIKKWYCSSQPERNEKGDSNPIKPAMPGDRVRKATPSGMASPARYQLRWREKTDQDLESWLEALNQMLNFTVTDFQINGALTKGSVLSKISQIYKPPKTGFSSYNQDKSCPAGYLKVKAV